MDTVTLRADGSSKVTIHKHGAHVTSWHDSRGREVIYTSPTAILDGSKAIRGGIPICFPQFGKRGPLRQHGFARNMRWAVEVVEERSATFVLQDTEETRSVWPYKFRVVYVVKLSEDGDQLEVKMNVENTGEQQFEFTTALHSYFTCDSEQVVLEEFDGVMYEDTGEEGVEKVQQGETKFGREVDRVYKCTKEVLRIPSVGLSLRKENLQDAVVWNPYVEKATALADLPDDGWKHFICIEPARVFEPASVAAGESWECALTMTSEV